MSSPASGSFLLAGSLCAELIEPLKLPHLTGYLAAGLLTGPYVLAARRRPVGRSRCKR